MSLRACGFLRSSEASEAVATVAVLGPWAGARLIAVLPMAFATTEPMLWA
jgi:hypothetical protein